MFYSTLSDEDLTSIYHKIVSEKEIFDILSNKSIKSGNNLKFYISKKRKNYIKYYGKLQNELFCSVNGIKNSQFII